MQGQLKAKEEARELEEAQNALAAKKEAKKARELEAHTLHMHQLQLLNENEFDRWVMTKAANAELQKAHKAQAEQVLQMKRVAAQKMKTNETKTFKVREAAWQ